MGFLTDGANKAFSSASKRAYVPQWYRSGSVYVGLGVGAVILVGAAVLGGGGGDDEVAPTASSPVGVEAVPAPGSEDLPTDPASPEPSGSSAPSTSAPSASPSTGSPAPSGVTTMVEISTTDGAQASVPQVAYQNADAATKALFSGDFSGVRLGEGVQTPSVVPVVGASLVALALSEAAPSSLTFEATVSVNGNEQKLPITLVLEDDGGYAYYPGA